MPRGVQDLSDERERLYARDCFRNKGKDLLFNQKHWVSHEHKFRVTKKVGKESDVPRGTLNF